MERALVVWSPTAVTRVRAKSEPASALTRWALKTAQTQQREPPWAHLQTIFPVAFDSYW